MRKLKGQDTESQRGMGLEEQEVREEVAGVVQEHVGVSGEGTRSVDDALVSGVVHAQHQTQVGVTPLF